MNWSQLSGSLPAQNIPIQQRRGAVALTVYKAPMRFGVSCLLAAGVTLGLFGMMQALVYVKDIKMVPAVTRTLTSFTPMHKDEPVLRTQRRAVQPQAVVTPPPLPVTVASSTVINIPNMTIETRAPKLPDAERMMPALPENLVLARRAEPLSPPSVQYPREMARKGISGHCEVTFSLSIRGLPFDPVAKCSHAGFESAALRAVKNAEFLPQVGANGPIEAQGMIYPIDFQLK